METPSIGLAQLLVLALIQGITEFLPVSSSAHLVLPAALTDWPDQGLAFDVAVHLGTLLAAVVFFRRDLARLAASGAALVVRRQRDENADLLLKIALATIPVVVAGLLFKAWIESHLRSVAVIATATVLFGIVLWWADGRRAANAAPGAGAPSYAAAMIIGAAQALALIPGTSRSGITLAAALALGLGRAGAVRFSFLLAIPAIAGAAVLTAIDATRAAALPWADLGLAFAVAAGSALLCIAAFIRFVDRIGMAPFAIYRIVLGLALLAFL